MCGIIGFISDRPSIKNFDRLKNLLYISAARGTDATGIAIVESEGITVVKEDIPSDKFITKYYNDMKQEISGAKIVLGHTRLATQGHQKDNNNNHPIVSEKYVMVHNGTCSSMDRIKDYSYKGTVDSEILLSYVERKGLKDGLTNLVGSASVAIVGSEDPLTVYLWRHSNPLWLAYDPKEETIFFASTDTILRGGLANILNFFSSFHMRELIEDSLYKVTPNSLSLENIGKVEPTSRWSPSHYYNSSNWGLHGYSKYDGWDEDFGSYRKDDKDKDAKDSKSGEKDKDAKDSKSGEKDKLTPLNSDMPGDKNSKVVGLAAIKRVYEDLSLCKWDSVDKMYTAEEVVREEKKSNRYYFNGHSKDFRNWERLETGGHVSKDYQFIKLFDCERKSHFLMTTYDAIKDGLLNLDNITMENV